jgi:hypothetical protein
MIKAVVFAAIGFWLSREVYERFDKKHQKELHEQSKRKVSLYLKKVGWSAQEIKAAEKEIFNHYE